MPQKHLIIILLSCFTNAIRCTPKALLKIGSKTKEKDGRLVKCASTKMLLTKELFENKEETPWLRAHYLLSKT